MKITGRCRRRSKQAPLPVVLRDAIQTDSCMARTDSGPVIGKTASACPGSVVDHIKALKRGGADDPSNMQWQTVEDAKAKDRVED